MRLVQDKLEIEGQFVIDEKLASYGKGHYKHDEVGAFGFIEVQINNTNGDFYIHASYINSPEDVSKRKINYISYIAEQVK
jgi:hypothetical protein